VEAKGKRSLGKKERKRLQVSTQKIKHGHGDETWQKREVSPEENRAENDPETWVVATRKEQEAKPSITVPLKAPAFLTRDKTVVFTAPPQRTQFVTCTAA
jgi:hypothetical protein